VSELSQARGIAHSILVHALTENNWIALGDDGEREQLFERIVKVIETEQLSKQPPHLFTRTVYSESELIEQIAAIEKLGFKCYVIGRDVEVIPLLGTGGRSVSDRWIIKVYEEVAME
jgi:hypothetical protein